MRTVTVSRNEHGLIQFAFDAETARATGVAAFTMIEGMALRFAEDILDGDLGQPTPFIGIVHDGGEINLELTARGL